MALCLMCSYFSVMKFPMFPFDNHMFSIKVLLGIGDHTS